MRWQDEQRAKGVTTWIVGGVLVVAFMLTSASPASAQITERETRHYAWLKLKTLKPRWQFVPVLNSCFVPFGSDSGACNFTVSKLSGQGVEVCTGVVRVTKREYPAPPLPKQAKPGPTLLAPAAPPASFKVRIDGDVTCRVAS